MQLAFEFHVHGTRWSFQCRARKPLWVGRLKILRAGLETLGLRRGCLLSTWDKGRLSTWCDPQGCCFCPWFEFWYDCLSDKRFLLFCLTLENRPKTPGKRAFR